MNATNFQNLTIRHDPDPEQAEFPWLLIDADGDVLDCLKTRAEAYKAMKESNDVAEHEFLVGSIDLADLSLETLRKIAKMI